MDTGGEEGPGCGGVLGHAPSLGLVVMATWGSETQEGTWEGGRRGEVRTFLFWESQDFFWDSRILKGIQSGNCG